MIKIACAVLLALINALLLIPISKLLPDGLRLFGVISLDTASLPIAGPLMVVVAAIGGVMILGACAALAGMIFLFALLLRAACFNHLGVTTEEAKKTYSLVITVLFTLFAPASAFLAIQGQHLSVLQASMAVMTAMLAASVLGHLVSKVMLVPQGEIVERSRLSAPRTRSRPKTPILWIVGLGLLPVLWSVILVTIVYGLADCDSLDSCRNSPHSFARLYTTYSTPLFLVSWSACIVWLVVWLAQLLRRYLHARRRLNLTVEADARKSSARASP